MVNRIYELVVRASKAGHHTSYVAELILCSVDILNMAAFSDGRPRLRLHHMEWLGAFSCRPVVLSLSEYSESEREK